MRVILDSSTKQLIAESDGERRVLPLYSPEAFEVLSRYWLEVGWTQKYSYSFTWLGRPIIQMPEDVMRIQEVIHRIQPDVIIETGVAHGGSLIFYASLCKVLDRGRVIGIDIEIRPHNRAAIQAHPLAPSITLLDGSSTDPAVLAQLRSLIAEGEKVLVLLDSCHTYAHVLAELAAYAPLVSVGSYLVAMDGNMADLAGAQGAPAHWAWDNPKRAVLEFVATRSDFKLEEPSLPFNESSITQRVTYWPSGYLKKVA